MDEFYSLLTGKYFNKIYTSKQNPSLAQVTSCPNIGYINIVEGLDNISTYKQQNKRFDDLQNQFNTTLAAYERNYVLFIEELLFNDYNKSLGQYSIYKNKVIADKNGNKYFVNQSGILRALPKSHNSDCPKKVALTVTDQVLKVFAKGPNISQNESCI